MRVLTTLLEATVVSRRLAELWRQVARSGRNSSVVTDQGIITSHNPGDLENFCSKIVEEVLEGKHERQAA